MSGFTPGPWVPRRAVKPDNTGGYDWAIIAPDKAIVAECFEVVDWAENGVDFDTRPVEANARLIAASPTLLEALQDFCLSAECAAGCDEGVDPDTAYSEILSFAGSALASSYDKARAAISKATGEQS